MFKKYDVVRSIKGRDKDRLLVVIKVENEKVFVVDGKERKLAKPKSKNPKHLLPLNKTINEGFLTGNIRLRKELDRLKNEI